MSLRRSEYQCSIDGAYFSTTFPHLLMMTYPTFRPPKSIEDYVPRVFGFKLHPSAYGTRCVVLAGSIMGEMGGSPGG